ncbi:MAG: histidine phosphatase family protein [Candidatus Pacebacteria bacterium]|nr:histidine phosphatase family protein [Candidatus Paceibacterota bacterium]
MGQTDIPLNQIGIAQATDTAEFLYRNNIKIDKILTSTLERAKSTARIINTFYNVTILEDDGLREANFGVAEGQVGAYDDLYESWVLGTTPLNAENWEDFSTRVIQSINQYLDSKSKFLIIAHGGVYSALSHNLGIRTIDIGNCIPYTFLPPNDSNNKWNIKQVVI